MARLASRFQSHGVDDFRAGQLLAVGKLAGADAEAEEIVIGRIGVLRVVRGPSLVKFDREPVRVVRTIEDEEHVIARLVADHARIDPYLAKSIVREATHSLGDQLHAVGPEQRLHPVCALSEINHVEFDDCVPHDDTSDIGGSRSGGSLPTEMVDLVRSEGFEPPTPSV
jgi:hypothetical protein